MDNDTTVDSDDPWYFNAFDERWRKLATFRSSDTAPKEEFVPHQAGLDGAGGSSYINDMVLRDKDDSGLWTDASDGVLEQRMFYLNNWRGDVVAMVTSTGYQAEMVRYSAYGTPFGYPGGDCNEDGAATGADRTVINGWISASTYDVRGDLDLDGDVDSTDSAVFASSYTGTTTGRGALSAGGNEVGYAGMMWFGSGQYLARHRWHDPELGRWGRRDPMGYVDGVNASEFVFSSPVLKIDPLGLYSWRTGPIAPGMPPIGPWADGGYVDDPPLPGPGPEVPPVAGAPNKCGPNITAWLQEELDLLNEWLDPATSAGLTSASTKLLLIKLGKTLNFDDTNFQSGDCPSGPCQGTVTLAGFCMGHNEVGNILWGAAAEKLGIPEDLAHEYAETGGNWTGRGPYTDQDKAGVSLGWNSGGSVMGVEWWAGAYKDDLDYLGGGGSGWWPEGCHPCDSPVSGGHTSYPTLPGGFPVLWPFTPSTVTGSGSTTGAGSGS